MLQLKQIKTIFMGGLLCFTPCLLFAEDKGPTDEALIPIEAFEDFEGWHQTFRFDLAPIFFDGLAYNAPLLFSQSVGDLPNSIPQRVSLNTIPGEFLPGNYLFVPENIESLTLMTDTGVFGGIYLNGDFDAYPQMLGFGSFTEINNNVSNNLVDVEADKLYMVKWWLETPFDVDDSVKLPLLQLIVGETGAYGLGRSLLGFDFHSANHIVGETLEFRQYFYAHDDGEIGFFINLIDLYSTRSPYASIDGHVGHNVTIQRIDVFEVNESMLTNEEVIFNQGQSDIVLAMDEAPPPMTAYEGGFDLDIWAGRDQFAIIAEGADESRNTSFSPESDLIGVGQSYQATGLTTDTLSYTINPGKGPAFCIWDTFKSTQVAENSTDPILSEVREVLEVDEGDLIVMDAWMSSTGPTEDLPFVRFGMASQNVMPGGGAVSIRDPLQGYVAYHEFMSSSEPFPLADKTEAVPSLNLINDQTKRVRLVWEVQLTSTPEDTGRYAFRPAIESFEIPAGFANGRNAQAQGTINTHRVVVTKYDKPAGAEDAIVPVELTDI